MIALVLYSIRSRQDAARSPPCIAVGSIDRIVAALRAGRRMQLLLSEAPCPQHADGPRLLSTGSAAAASACRSRLPRWPSGAPRGCSAGWLHRSASRCSVAPSRLWMRQRPNEEERCTRRIELSGPQGSQGRAVSVVTTSVITQASIECGYSPTAFVSSSQHSRVHRSRSGPARWIRLLRRHKRVEGRRMQSTATYVGSRLTSSRSASSTAQSSRAACAPWELTRSTCLRQADGSRCG